MRFQSFGAVCALLWAGQALATSFEEGWPYAGAALLYERSDTTRSAGSGFGGQLQFGLPLDDFGHPGMAIESTLHDLERERDADGGSDQQLGLVLDLVQDFRPDNTLELRPFLLAGVGVVRNRMDGEVHYQPAFNFGGGALLPLGWKGVALRLEARVLTQFLAPEGVNDPLTDFRVAAGLHVPLRGLFERRAPDVPPARECALAVVDPVTGRTDCGVDSDRDGVLDPNDQCPGTPGGTQVDARGCGRPMSEPASLGDQDGDGIADSADQCPDTRRDLTIDASGCMVTQSLTLSSIQFDAGTALLTPAARQVLDQLVATLKNQPSVDVQIIGRALGVADAKLAQILARQRGESVRQYLIQRAIDPARLQTRGDGPVELRSPEPGAAGARVELTLITG